MPFRKLGNLKNVSIEIYKKILLSIKKIHNTLFKIIVPSGWLGFKRKIFCIISLISILLLFLKNHHKWINWFEHFNKSHLNYT